MTFKAGAASGAAFAILCGLGLTLGGCPTTDNGNTNDNGNENTNGSAASVERGRQKFDASCSACHPASYVKTYRDHITTDLGTLGSSMRGITLTEQEVADLKEYLEQL